MNHYPRTKHRYKKNSVRDAMLSYLAQQPNKTADTVAIARAVNRNRVHTATLLRYHERNKVVICKRKATNGCKSRPALWRLPT
jgi:hypothetical protein